MKATKSLLGRTAALAGAVALSVVGLVGVAAPAQAAALGTLTLNPTTGDVAANPALLGATTSAACPAGFGDQAVLRFGPVGGQVANLNKIASIGNYDQAPFTLDANRSITTALGAAPANGEYLFVIECISGVNGPHPDRFETAVTVTGGAWKVKGAVEPATPTTTALAASPAGPVELGTNVTLTATVAPAAATGSVDFRRGGASLGSAPVSNGTATLTTNALSAGTNSLTAVFTPADAAAFAPSTSSAVSVQVTVPGSLSATQELTADVAPGAFSLAVAGNAVALTGGVVGGAATGALNKATVTDLRGTNAGWNLTGQVEPFVGPAGATIAANQLGWVPTASEVDENSGTVVAGAAANPGAGLGDARALCSAAQGSSAGVFECGAALTLDIPDTAAPGSYSATLTLTLV
ncbi:Ig-like domain repeat protein [Micromonospora sp. NPDC049523]|uniref:Ig-like domain repeat protein n=1 Tax=Micromonospora sp. NPDC049523 TaxID=3155921 RepID=UPI003446D0ED